jgi:hypothetical protein
MDPLDSVKPFFSTTPFLGALFITMGLVDGRASRFVSTLVPLAFFLGSIAYQQ